MNHYFLLGLLIFGCGIFGGLINYFRLTRDKNSTLRFLVAKSLLTGLGASALVPLFLNTISSDLLTSSQTNPIDYFFIGGFCLISAIFSSKFIDSLGDRVIQDVNRVSNEVEKVREELDNSIVERESETFIDSKEEYDKLDYDEKEIIESLYDTKFTYRSISGISLEKRKSKDFVQSILNKLETKGYVMKYVRDNGWIRWKLTERGREIFAKSFGDEESY